jgi:glutaminyl-tRNA synthetase
LNPDSKRVLPRALVEASLRDAAVGQTFQFERVGYFAVDKERRTPTGRMVFNRVVTLKDTWATKV